MAVFARFCTPFISFALLVVAMGCYGQSPFPLTDAEFTYKLDASVEVFIDKSDRVEIDQIVQPQFQSNFKPSNGYLTYGYLKSTLWLKVETKLLSPDSDWFLEIPAPFLEYVDFYQLENDQRSWEHTLAGYYRPQSSRKIKHTSHVTPIKFNSESLSTIYIKITGISPKTFPVYAIEKEKFYGKSRLEDIGYGIFFGVLVVMFFYNLFIFLTLKQYDYLLYICTIVCTFLIFVSTSGYAGRFLWPETPMLNFYAGRLSLGMLAIFLSVFTIRFLEVKQYSKIMYYALVSLIPLAILAIILVATRTLSSAGNNLISISTVLFMVTGIVVSVKGNKTGYYFIAAWTIYLVGGLLLTLRNSGVFDFNFWTTHFVEIGAALETVIIAFALGDRYRRYKLEKEEAQRVALQLQQEATEKLERKVNERTEQLSKANKELKNTLETNKLQTRIIEDKNAELDAFFYRISHDLKGPISSLLGLSFLAKREVQDEQALMYIDKANQQVQRLDNIINGLIKLTKLNDTDLQKERIDFEVLVNGCIDTFHAVPNFDAIIFKKNIQKGIEFYSEWTLLNAIIQNLIENAIKYAGNESPFVSISVTQEAEQVIIEVEDNGQGIPSEHQSKIFEMFYRATQHANGTGLGLYILKRSLDRLKGSIEIKSEVGTGSTFVIKLPLVESYLLSENDN